jgi:excinuclease ABC subunit A
VVIEHNLDVIKTADWIIDLGPEGGVKGGEIVAVGTPEQVVKAATEGSAGGSSEGKPRSYTGRYLAPLLAKKVVSEAAE